MNSKIMYVIIGVIIGILIGSFIGLYYRNVPGNLECAYKLGKFTNPPRDNLVTIVYGFDPEYPPFTQVLPNGSVVGFDVDVINWIAKKYGWKIDISPGIGRRL